MAALYNHETNCVEVTLDNQFRVTFNCQNRNAQVTLADPLDISYLTRLSCKRRSWILCQPCL